MSCCGDYQPSLSPHEAPVCASCGATVYHYEIYGREIIIAVNGGSVTVNDVTITASHADAALSKHLRNCIDTRTAMAIRKRMRGEFS